LTLCITTVSHRIQNLGDGCAVGSDHQLVDRVSHRFGGQSELSLFLGILHILEEHGEAGHQFLDAARNLGERVQGRERESSREREFKREFQREREKKKKREQKKRENDQGRRKKKQTTEEEK
jgi:hypothetical protein